jgi:hypothetical protein
MLECMEQKAFFAAQVPSGAIKRMGAGDGPLHRRGDFAIELN